MSDEKPKKAAKKKTETQTETEQQPAQLEQEMVRDFYGRLVPKPKGIFDR